MSAKWIRSKAWDDRHLTGVLWPVKAVLRTFSSIWFAVVLLVLVAVYGVLASVPIGVVALAPTWLVYAACLVGLAAVGAWLPVWAAMRMLARAGVGRPVRFAVGTLGLLVLLGAIWVIWTQWLWPMLRFDERTGSGVRFFAEFVDRYRAVQLRRIPGLEMSELEFYGWWPLSAVLILFVVNLITATVRRIEFVFVNLGVLSVHTGIVTLALGSAYYASHKQEGDMLLLSGGLTPAGEPIPGRPDTGFYDNVAVALWVTGEQSRGWEQRRLSGVPRYNDYNLGAVAGYEPPVPANEQSTQAGRGDWPAHRDYGPLDVAVPGDEPSAPGGGATRLVDPDVKFRIVGYASYADLVPEWVPRESLGGPGGPGLSMREVHAILKPPAGSQGAAKPEATWRLIPELPSERVTGLDILNIELTRGMSEQRWRDLAENLPAGARHALVVEVPGLGPVPGYRTVLAIEPGQTYTLGQTGWKIEIKDIAPEPPFPIITKGYEGARSSVVVVRVTPTEDAQKAGLRPFERYVYHRFPEINQDLSDELNERGMPTRRDADARIRLAYVDASVLQVYLDERPDGLIRALVRMPQAGANISQGLKQGDEVPIAPRLSARIGARIDNVQRVEVPRVVPEQEREKGRIGNHQAAAVAVEVLDKTGLKQTVWAPFTQYLGMDQETVRRVRLGDGRKITLAFGRVRHEFFPPMSVRLLDFQMIPYPHSDTPRDYRSEVAVGHNWTGRPDGWLVEERATSLNEPLLVRTPFVGREDVPAVVNWIGSAVAMIAPNQYKFSQAGWDAGGWKQSEEAAASGQAKRAWARFTILGVGNNPGIHIIATGAVIMAVGIPWAFYVKPWILRRRKAKIQRELRRTGLEGDNGTASRAAGDGATPAAEPQTTGATR